ncbi:MAG: hypothetical protein JSS95_08510 [Acidobacteria bacterium]|nr:hypothetical protein [Acidobacteriota bacterium]
MKKTPANSGKPKEPSRGELAERFRKMLELSMAAYQNDPAVDLDAPIRRITWEEKNAEHFAFHREFYEKERSK